MRKRVSTAILLALIIIAANGQAVQYGYVEEYQMADEKTPLKNVVVSAAGATSRTTADGRFKLEFQSLKIGDRVPVDLNKVAVLKDYVLFNKEAVEQWTVSARNVYFRIVLCKKRVFDDLVMTYYNVSDKSYKEQLLREREKAKRLKEEGEIQQQEYERLLKEADERYQNALRHLRENAELVARIDESELDEEQAHILQLAKEGRIDEAVELIRKSKTAELFDQASAKRDYAEQQRRYYEGKEAEAQQEWVRLLARMNDEEHYIRQTLGEDSSNYTSRAYLALSLLLQGRYDEAAEQAIVIKEQTVEGKPLKDSMLQFIAGLEKKKHIPEARRGDIERFKELLK